MVVRGNRVSRCRDVYLNAEASEDVLFADNDASFAGTAVLAIFYCRPTSAAKGTGCGRPAGTRSSRRGG